MSLYGDVIKKVFSLAGLNVSRNPPHHTLERHLQDLFRAFQINCVLDVGAHYGEYAGLLRGIGYTGQILSFEPTPESFAILSAKASNEPSWRVYPWALSDTTQTRRMNLFQHSTFNSLEDLSEYGRDKFGLVAKDQPEVEVKRLDSIFHELIHGIDQPRVYLKMDTQGHDHHVLDGASGVLEQIPLLQSELAVRRIYSGIGQVGDMLNYYGKAGYTPTGFFPVNTERGGFAIVEVDCVMQRVGAR